MIVEAGDARGSDPVHEESEIDKWVPVVEAMNITLQ
jgi:hypothetical protein